MVRVGFPGAPRLEWYDRNPIPRVAYWINMDMAPHAVTLRISYTCPTGKKAMIESITDEVVRTASATAPIRAEAVFKLTPSGEAMKDILPARIQTNNVGDRSGWTLGSTFMMFAGDVLGGYTEDLSTGGTCSYIVIYKATEFDA